jgi:hypothetical protein
MLLLRRGRDKSNLKVYLVEGVEKMRMENWKKKKKSWIGF